MNIIDSLRWRYATKKFDDSRFVSESDIDTLCEAFNLTATSYGLQPIKLLVVKNKELQQKMQNASWNQAQVGTASHVLVFCIEKNIDDSFIENYFKRFPVLNEGVLAYKNVIKGRFEGQAAEDIKAWSTKQAYIALGNLMTVCADLQIDSCPMEGFVPSEVDIILRLEEKALSAVLLLPIGYRSEDDKGGSREKIRRPIEDITSKIY